ncbi:hypothetical protein HDV57DRAFT_53117 [Trichoderma longibrachiatum]
MPDAFRIIRFQHCLLDTCHCCSPFMASACGFEKQAQQQPQIIEPSNHHQLREEKQTHEELQLLSTATASPSKLETHSRPLPRASGLSHDAPLSRATRSSSYLSLRFRSLFCAQLQLSRFPVAWRELIADHRKRPSLARATPYNRPFSRGRR